MGPFSVRPISIVIPSKNNEPKFLISFIRTIALIAAVSDIYLFKIYQKPYLPHKLTSNFIFQLSSFAYVISCSWFIGVIMHEIHELKVEDNILLSCLSFGILISVVQTVVSLRLFCKCNEGDLKCQIFSWICVQLLLLGICVVSFFLSFAFSPDGKFENFSEFSDKTKHFFIANFRVGNKSFDSKIYIYAVTYSLMLNGLSTLVGSVIMRICVGFRVKQ